MLAPFILANVKAYTNYKYLVSIKKLPEGIIKRSVYFPLTFPYFDNYPKQEESDFSVKLAKDVNKYLKYYIYSIFWLIFLFSIEFLYSYLRNN